MDNSVTYIEWTADTSALDHMTGNKNLLADVHNYIENDSIVIGDGFILRIASIGDSIVKNKNEKNLLLNTVLLVPNLKKNLISVSQLTS